VQNLMRITGQNALIVTTNCGAINFSSVYLSPRDGVFGRTAGLSSTTCSRRDGAATRCGTST